jgi:hypothetical protein
LDKDFGELAFKNRLPIPNGMILLRIHGLSDEIATDILVDALQTRDDWSGYFSVIEPGRVRMTPLTDFA